METSRIQLVEHESLTNAIAQIRNYDVPDPNAQNKQAFAAAFRVLHHYPDLATLLNQVQFTVLTC